MLLTKWKVFQTTLKSQILFNKITRLIALVLCLNLCQCFLVPRLKVKRTLSAKNCSKLSSQFFYDLSIKEIKTSVSLCLQKKQYHSALILLNYLETKSMKLKEKANIWKQKANIYQNHLFLYSEAILELEKLLKYQPADYGVLYNLLQAQIKKESFDKALKTVSLLLGMEALSDERRLEIQFIKARLLTLNKNRKEALELFTKLKKKNFHFFDKMQGGFYTALLLEEEERFEEAMEELKFIQWPFSEVKSKHWQYRKKNSAVSR